MSCASSFKSSHVFHKVLRVLLKFAFFPVSIILFSCWILCLLYRVLLCGYVKLFKNDFGEILSGTSAIFKDETENSHNLSPLFWLEIEGVLKMDRVMQIFTENVIEPTFENKTRYPELKQYLTNFGGYWFWKKESRFNISNHIHEWNCQNEDDEFSQILECILNRGWDKQKSPWELILLTAQGSNFIMLRMHHSMGDGKSLIKLLVECLGKKEIRAAKPRYIKESGWSVIKKFLVLPFEYLSTTYHLHMLGLETKHHPWNSLRSDTKVGVGVILKTLIAYTLPISLSKLKTVAKLNKVYPASVLMSIISGALTSVINQQKQHVMYTLAQRNHPSTLVNHYSGVIQFPKDNPSPQARLNFCNDEHHKLKRSLAPNCVKLCLTQLASWPEKIRRKMMDSNVFSVGISNMSMDEEGFDVDGHPCISAGVSIGMHFGSLGVLFMVLGYKNTLQISVNSNNKVMEKADVQKLATLVNYQFGLLCQEIDV